MKLNLNFVNKVPKIAKDNEIILLTQKVIKSKEIKQLAKSVLNNKLFSEGNFLFSILFDRALTKLMFVAFNRRTQDSQN